MNSILKQTYDNLEIIMVDDGSTDGSDKICDDYEKMDKRVVVFHKKNGGVSDARNYGLERVNGKYITFIDPDDYVDLDYIEYMYNLLCKYNVKLLSCKQYTHFPNGVVKEAYKDGFMIVSFLLILTEI